MTEQQLAEIEARWWNPFRLGDLPKNGLDDVSDLLAEVRRLQRAEEKALNYLEHNCCDAPQSFDCEETNRNCRDCWKEYLESEVADK